MVVRLQVELSDKGEWVKVFDSRDCTLFVGVDNPPEVGTQVRVDLALEASGPRVILYGRVIARRVALHDGLAPGCSIAIGFEDREKINYVNGFVRGGMLDLRERRRLPVRLGVTYGSRNGPVATYTRDINEQGVFVVAEDPLPEQSQVHLRIDLPDGSALTLTGTVSHTVLVEDEDVPGMGIVFELDEVEQTRLSAIIDGLEERFRTGDLPDEILM